MILLFDLRFMINVMIPTKVIKVTINDYSGNQNSNVIPAPKENTESRLNHSAEWLNGLNFTSVLQWQAV